MPTIPQCLPGSLDRKGGKRIRAVLGNRMLLTAFQPIRELSAGNVAGFEAVARFVSRDGASADTWLRETAAAGLGEDLEIAALHCALSAALLESGDVAMDRVVIELVGQAADGELDGLIRVLGPLRQLGLRVAVDGSGAASPDQILNWCSTSSNSTAASSTPSLTRREDRLPLAT